MCVLVCSVYVWRSMSSTLKKRKFMSQISNGEGREREERKKRFNKIPFLSFCGWEKAPWEGGGRGWRERVEGGALHHHVFMNKGQDDTAHVAGPRCWAGRRKEAVLRRSPPASFNHRINGSPGPAWKRSPPRAALGAAAAASTHTTRIINWALIQVKD